MPSAWEQFTPFLRIPPEIRKVVSTTNLVESINDQLRKVTKTRRHFPTDEAAPELLRLAARNISDTSEAATSAPAPGDEYKPSTPSRSTSPADSASPDNPWTRHSHDP